jgi:Tol biopolymer transport system component
VPPDDAANGQAQPDVSAGRLDSWKEVAVYLRRDIKTVQRWERREGLPVHRLHHDKLGSVYAYRDELDAWVAGRRLATNGGHATANGAATGSPARNEAPGGEASFPSAKGVAHGTDHLHGADAIRVPASRWRPTARRLAAVAAIIAAAAGSWTAGRLGRPGPAGRGRAVFLVEPPAGTVFAGTIVDPEPTISPDGTRIVFRAAERDTGRQRLYLRRLDRATAEKLAGTDQGVQPFWSPDSRYVAFFGGGELKRVDLASGLVTSLAQAPRPEGGAWLASGDIIFNPDEGTGIHMLKGGGGPPVAVTVPDASASQTRHVSPQELPDGRGFLYLAAHDDPRKNAVWMWSGTRGGDRRVVSAPRMGRVAPGGWMLLFRGHRLVAQRLDVGAGTLAGAPVELAEALEADDSNSRRPGFSISSTGVLAYWPVTRTAVTRLTWFDRHGRETGVVGSPGDYPFVELAPDGRHAVVQRTDEASGAPDVWLLELSSGAATRLTASPVNEEDPVWSPDGGEVVFAKHAAVGAAAQLRIVRPRRPLVEERVGTRPVEGHPTDWSRDGRLLVFQRSSAGTLSDVFALPVPDGAPVALVSSPFNERHGRLSPDGRFVAYSSDVSGRLEVYVKTLDQDGAITQVSNASGAHPRWRADGRELFYLSAGGILSAVPVARSSRFSAGRPMPLFDARPPLPLAFLDTLYDAAADGQRFLVAAADRPVTRSFTVVIDALAELPR